MTNPLALKSPPQDSFGTATTAHGKVGLTQKAASILEARGIDLELAIRLGWRSSTSDKNGDGIEIPYYVNGEEVNFKFRTLSGAKRFYQTAGAEKVFYNCDILNELTDEPVIITEGEMDCIIAMQCGYRAVSVPDGAPASRVDADSKKYSYFEGFPKTGAVILAVDNDEAGGNLYLDIVDILGAHRCRFVKYPEGCKDLNEVFLKAGQDGVRHVLDGAKWVDVDGVYSMDELPPHSNPEGVRLPWVPITIRRGDFSVFTGVPNMGKTQVTNFIAHTLAEKGWRVAFASFEQKPQTQHRYNLRALALGYSPLKARQDEIAHVDKWINDRYSFMVPSLYRDEVADLDWLMDKMAQAVIRRKADLIIIDPWNELENTSDRRQMSQTEYTGFAIRQLKKFAVRYQVHVMVVTHPAKMQRNRDGEYPIPSLYDIADSAHWANKTDLGVVVHKTQTGNTIFKVCKSRDYEVIGKPDDYILQFTMDSKRFSELSATHSYGE